MIITCKKRISFQWIVLAVLPWGGMKLQEFLMAVAFIFSMRKFVENPAALTFLLTAPMYISWIVPPVVNFLSDRVWTRWGRRKPFIVVSWVGTITSITLMPLATDFGWLLAGYIAFSIFNDIAGPVESLKMEIVPPAQRVTSQAVLSWINQVAVLIFWVVALGRFEEMSTMFGVPVSGEQGLYWSVAMGMVVMILFLMLGIKETNPHSAILHERFSLRNVFRGLFSEHLWPVYILAFSVAVLATGLGAFYQLLVTEQWGYTKQEQGTNIAIGGILNLCLIPMLGLLSNRVGRTKVYVGLVIAAIVVNLSQFLYYTRVLYDGRPTLVELVVFGEVLSIIGILKAMSLTPLVYDFVPRNELGTYAAGSGLVTRITGVVTANLMGLFILAYSNFFLGPAGEMVRLTFCDDQPRAFVQSAVSRAQWNDPQTGRPIATPRLTAEAWYATGAKLDHGRGFEIRLRDDNSKEIRSQRDRLDTELSEHKAFKTVALNQLKKSLPADKAAKLQATVANEAVAEQELTAEIQQLETNLDKRAAAFRTQVEQVLGDKLLHDGEQVLGAGVEPALIATFPVTRRPASADIEQALDQLRQTETDLIDLRVVPVGDGWGLALSARATANINHLQSILAQRFQVTTPTVETAKALHVDLRILEDPLDRHPSPITRLVNHIAALFTTPDTPARRLNALGRGLRQPGLFDHIGATVVPGDDNAIRLTVITGPVAEKLELAPEPVARRLTALLGLEAAPQAGALYAAALPAAKTQRITIARPVIVSAFTKQQYDYLMGTMATFALQLVGLGITLFFLYMVKTGKVRRRGVEEAEAIA